MGGQREMVPEEFVGSIHQMNEHLPSIAQQKERGALVPAPTGAQV